METADDASETQSQAQADLVWDHTGDVESDPLLGRESEQQANGNRPGTIQLSREQAQDLLRVLDNTRYVLETFVGQAQGTAAGGGGARRVRRSWWAFHCFPARRRSIAKFIFLITAALQAVNLLVVSVIDIWPRRDDESVMIGTGITMIMLQLANLFFIVMVSLRLVRQLYKHRVSILLLGQSYVSTLLLFAGIYTLTYRMDPKSWKFIQEQLETDPILVIELYSKFLFFSVSTATLCGSDNVLPKYWYNCLFTAIQMLMSFIYFASILGQTLSQDTQYWLGVNPEDQQDQTSSSATGRGARQPSVSSVNAAAARVSSSAGQVWRNYGSGGTTAPSVSPARDGVDGVDGGGDVERGLQNAVMVDVEPDTAYSINSSYPS